MICCVCRCNRRGSRIRPGRAGPPASSPFITDTHDPPSSSLAFTIHTHTHAHTRWEIAVTLNTPFANLSSCYCLLHLGCTVSSNDLGTPAPQYSVPSVYVHYFLSLNECKAEVSAHRLTELPCLSPSCLRLERLPVVPLYITTTGSRIKILHSDTSFFIYSLIITFEKE